jgi:pimeloyl-ACP methyl ester carboxylesterase
MTHNPLAGSLLIVDVTVPKGKREVRVLSLRVNDYDMAFAEHGSGIPLLLLHGGFVDLRLWAPQMDDFGARYRTIAVSFRRCWPERWNGEGEGYTTQQHVSDIAGFIDAVGEKPVHLLGASLGAHVAFRVAQRFPDLIRALVLIEPAGPFDKGLEPPNVMVQRVAGPSGMVCGTILWEAKRTKSWSDGWLAKLREDKRAAKADLAMIVSHALPKGLEHFDHMEASGWPTHAVPWRWR